VVPAITTLEPPACKLITVPEIVAAAPATRVCEPTTYAGGDEDADEATAIFCVLLAATTRLAPLEAREYTVSECVICPPGIRVWEAMTNAEEGFAVMVEPSTVIFAGVVTEVAGSAITCVLLPAMTRASPFVARE
jgi:hypothetical protein